MMMMAARYYGHHHTEKNDRQWYNNKEQDAEEQYEEEEETSKKSRTTWKQRVMLERIFTTHPYPNLPLRVMLGKLLDTSPRKVQIWYQNRRTKERSIGDKDAYMMNLLAHAADPHTTIDMQDKNGNTLLMNAIGMDHTAVHMLISKGANCNIPNFLGWTPMYAAVLYNRNALVELLLTPKYNVDVNAKEHRLGFTALHLASLKGHEGIVNFLMTKSPNIAIDATDNEKRTALHHAAVRGHLNIVQLLVTKGANVNAKTGGGQTVLHCAVIGRSPSVCEQLVRLGAKISEKDQSGRTAADYAWEFQYLEILKILGAL